MLTGYSKMNSGLIIMRICFLLSVNIIKHVLENTHVKNFCSRNGAPFYTLLHVKMSTVYESLFVLDMKVKNKKILNLITLSNYYI